MSVTILLLRALLLLAVAIFSYYLVAYIQKNSAIKKSFIRLYANTEDKYEQRKIEKERIYLEEGNQSKENFFYRFDLLIERSGLRKRFEFLTTEIYIAIIVVITLVGYLLGHIIGGMLIGATVVMCVIVGSYGIVYILSGKNYEKVDNEIIPFVNLLENYSGSDNDIVNIMGNVYMYLNDPLKTYIENFYNEATTSGDYRKAFMNLENRIESVRIKALIRNIEICSRHEANYDEIIKDERRTLRSYSKAKEKRKTIRANGRSDIVASLVMSGILVVMFMGFAPGLTYNLLNSTIGNIILLYCITVLGLCAWNFIAFDKGEKM